jgi:prepilin-type N-terminal cleavage/methylation domain-containing protein
VKHTPIADRGLSLIELMFAMAIAATLAAVAIPVSTTTLDDFRARSAARHVAQRIARLRAEAVKRSSFVGLRFVASGSDYSYATYADGNHNGIRSADVASGADPRLNSPELLAWNFPGIRFGIAPGIPDADNQPVSSQDGVRIGSARILSMNPDGSATPGTVYIVSLKGAQYAVRVLGATGRTRVLKFDRISNRWVEQ